MLDKTRQAPSLSSLIDWLSSKDPNGEYCFPAAQCLYWEYALDIGYPTNNYRGMLRAITPEDLGIANCLAGVKPWTYGAALARAKDLQAQTKEKVDVA